MSAAHGARTPRRFTKPIVDAIGVKGVAARKLAARAAARRKSLVADAALIIAVVAVSTVRNNINARGDAINPHLDRFLRKDVADRGRAKGKANGAATLDCFAHLADGINERIALLSIVAVGAQLVSDKLEQHVLHDTDENAQRETHVRQKADGLERPVVLRRRCGRLEQEPERQARVECSFHGGEHNGMVHGEKLERAARLQKGLQLQPRQVDDHDKHIVPLALQCKYHSRRKRRAYLESKLTYQCEEHFRGVQCCFVCVCVCVFGGCWVGGGIKTQLVKFTVSHFCCIHEREQVEGEEEDEGGKQNKQIFP